MVKKPPLYPHVPRSQQPRVIPTEPTQPRDREVLEFLPDSTEDLRRSLDDTGYREKIRVAFMERKRIVQGLRK